jgi:CBS domain containing-hemolysin-like protein
MTAAETWSLVAAVVLILVAVAFSATEAALGSFSRARAEELVAEGVGRAKRLARMLQDPPRFLNTALFLRSLSEIGAIVLVAAVGFREFGDALWHVVLVVALMLVVSFVVIGVAPRTLGRQHAQRVALATAGVMDLLTRVLGPIPQMLIMLGNAITPGKGFSEGPFASEAELRELVDLAEASQVIESDERQMIHSVFELGDTLVREVMVPRTDVVFIERFKTLRQAMSLALRSGFSRIPVVGENLDDVVGFAYMKDIAKRVFDKHDAEQTERVESVMRSVLYVPDSKPVDELLREMQATRKHVAIVVDEYGGTAGLVTIEDLLEEIVGEITDEYDAAVEDVERLSSGAIRVNSRFPVDDLGELTGVEIEDDDVDSVGGLIAKHLGRVPIAGSTVEVDGLRFEAEGPSGRRNRIGSVLITHVEPPVESEGDEPYADSHVG